MKNPTTCTAISIGLLLLSLFYSCKRHQTSDDFSLPIDSSRFEREVMAKGLDEPMEMAIAPDGRVVFIERRGNIKLYLPEKNQVKWLGKMNVFSGFEDGLLGVTLDPSFSKTGWVYFYYSPADEKPIQRISRFKLVQDTLIFSTEKILLEIDVQRETCCHSAGSLTFGEDDNLYISVGDNTSSKASDGYTPIDERPGRAPYDAQKSSANTHDLRGKILRIHPEKNGTYTIPNGNLFAKDGSEGRAEIYTMGCRNPFRISVDVKNGWLAWGDVGPDAGEDDKKGRGPKSFDEYNLTKKAGNFGWPYFVGYNFAYRDFNFTDSSLGQLFDPQKPINESPNNTGPKLLPPAIPAWISYPYAESKDFPELGSGARSAMAGPFYHIENYKPSKMKLPQYFDGKLFIYEWMRDWIMAISIDKNGKLEKMEKFLPQEKWNHPIDIEFGSDGSMYVLEYGTNWFSQNDNAQLNKIVYRRGNRNPKINASISDTVGKLPLKIKFEASQSIDLDSDKLSFVWQFDSLNSTFDTPNGEIILQKAGIYYPTLKVFDGNGGISYQVFKVIAGNSYPKININITNGNSTFYWPHLQIAYEIKVSDIEDGSVDVSSIGSQVYFVEDKKAGNSDPERPITDHQLIAASDCKSCHHSNRSSVGPSFFQIANKYPNDLITINKLAKKVISGGSGVWSEQHAMSAHPQLSIEKATEMVKYIFTYSYVPSFNYIKNIPLKGVIDCGEKNGNYELKATYTDKGYNGKYNLTTTKKLVLKKPIVEAEMNNGKNNCTQFVRKRPNGEEYKYIGAIVHQSNIFFQEIDLTNIKQIGVFVNSNMASGVLELRADSANGTLLSTYNVKPTYHWEDWYEIRAPIIAEQRKYDLYFVYKNADPTAKDGKGMINIDYIKFYNF